MRGEGNFYDSTKTTSTLAYKFGQRNRDNPSRVVDATVQLRHRYGGEKSFFLEKCREVGNLFIFEKKNYF